MGDMVNVKKSELFHLFGLAFYFTRISAADIQYVNGAYLVAVGIDVVLFLA